MLLILQSLVPGVYKLNEFLLPHYFKTFVEAAKKLSGYDEDKNTYNNPSNALKIGHSILQCCDILESQSIIEGKSEEELQTLRNFKKIFQMEWKYAISSNAIQDMSKKKFNKSIKLPNADDIQLLHNYLLDEMIKGKNLIEKGLYTQVTYKMVCQCLLSQIILLNRRRSGEVERIKVNDYLNRDQNKMQNEIIKSLTKVEARLSKNFVRFVIRGKKGRGVPVLLTPVLKETLDVLLNRRSSFGILESNPYIFAIPYTVEGTYRGTDCLRKSADACGASDPEQLRSTKLRKHIATMSQLLNLSNSDREQLANFMGHDLAIHNEYYRLPDETLQISRVSKILLAMESGKLHELKGKSLEEFDQYMMPVNLSDSELDEAELDEETVTGI
ncbi:unnamed protein product [Macrosiphum euphorbiae]|uniref:Tyr recombinase domain-containing protein n=1 Tax=Macrosiphum euphorbiae TaxID=13131 RepID=A0AAV0WDH5_9HEMI|nr:unnamed protein product [Macrosiphum euphorbiae]